MRFPSKATQRSENRLARELDIDRRGPDESDSEWLHRVELGEMHRDSKQRAAIQEQFHAYEISNERLWERINELEDQLSKWRNP